MCGRFALFADDKMIGNQFKIDMSFKLEPRFNIAPSEKILALRNSDSGSLEGVMLHWGLIPFWAKDKKIGYNLINARAETVATKPAFRSPFKNHRCIVIMSGFFEWQQQDNGKKPYFIKYQDDKLLAVAALWDEWQSQTGDKIQSCSLITTSANHLMQPIHNRMPVILDAEAQKYWLDNQHFNRAALQELLIPFKNASLIAYPVTSKMNNSQYQSQDAVVPLN